MADEQDVTTQQPAQAEAPQAAQPDAQPAAQTTESDAATDPAESERRDRERIEEAQRKAAFAELRRQNREHREALERERQEKQQLLQRVLAGSQQPGQGSDVAPDPARFAGGEFNPEYMRELARYEAKQLVTSHFETLNRRQQEEAQRRQAETMRQGWFKSLSDAQSKYGDYEVIVEAASADIPQPVQQLLVGLKDGADILYHLAKDPAKARALNGNSVEIAAALGELRAEARYAARQAQAAKAAEEATHQPMKPGNGGGRSNAEPDPRDTERWIAWRKKQLKAEGSSRY